MFRILLALLALATSLLADDRGNVASSAQPASKETPLTIETNSATKETAAIPLNERDPLPLTQPATSTSTADADFSGAADFSHESTSSNPWLYIMIGFLLVTGVLLYIDPRIF